MPTSGTQSATSLETFEICFGDELIRGPFQLRHSVSKALELPQKPPFVFFRQGHNTLSYINAV